MEFRSRFVYKSVIGYITDRQPMTVCIAAICEGASDSPKIVFSADLLISAGLQFEHLQGKISRLSDYCYLMTSSNDSLRSDMIAKEVLNKLREKVLAVKEIVELFTTECINEKRKQQERDVLGPLGLTYDTFHANSKSMSPDLIKEIAAALTYYRYNFQTDFLIVGIDMNPRPTAHIYTVNQDGEPKLHDYLGFAVIGSGTDLAFPELTKLPYLPLTIGWEEALLRVYDAKKVAERMGGVGRYTNLVVLNINVDEKTKVRTVTAWWPIQETFFKLLDEGFEKIKKNEYEIMKKEHEELRELVAKIKAEESQKTDSKEPPKKVDSPEAPH